MAADGSRARGRGVGSARVRFRIRPQIRRMPDGKPASYTYVDCMHSPTDNVVAAAAFPDVFILPDGTTLVLRAVEPGDRDRIRDLFGRLSPISRYRRYLSPKPELSASELAALSDIDHIRHEALAAVDQRNGSFVGVARSVQWPDRPEAAEMAIEVEDDRHGLGIGSCLTARILERARDNGFSSLTASALRDNLPARALLRRFGFSPVASSGPLIELERQLLVEMAVAPAA